MKREKASNMKKAMYSLNVVKKNTTKESMQKDAPNQMEVREFTSMVKVKNAYECKYFNL